MNGKRGQVGGVISTLMMIFVVGIMVSLLVIVNSKFNQSLPTTNLTAAEQQTLSATQANVTTGFNLSSLIPLVLVIVLIIGIVGLVSHVSA